MIKISWNKKIYHIQKEKLISILEKISEKEINEKEIKKYLTKYKLYNEYFLKNINKL